LISITGIAVEPLTFILDHLRPEDREEIAAVRGDKFDAARMASELTRISSSFDAWIFWNADAREAVARPIAALGAYAMTPKVAGCWAFGTDEWPLALRAVTKHAKAVMVPKLLEAGFHRAECRALATREDTWRWLTSLGWQQEAVLAEFGTRREDFILFAWRAPDERADHPPEPEQQSEVSLS
jgi:hypothetical protein